MNHGATESYGIHWFRRDLRVAGNSALKWNFQRHAGRVVGLFAFDPVFLARPDIGTDRFLFLIETLARLRDELREIGSDLLVLDEGPDQAFERLWATLSRRAASVSYSRDYEPFAVSRDARVEHLLREKLGLAEVHSARDHLLIEPHELHKPDVPGSWYQVFTPFSRRWLELRRSGEGEARLLAEKSGLQYLEARRKGKTTADLFRLKWADVLGKRAANFPDRLDHYRKTVRAKAGLKAFPEAGSLAAFRALDHFIEHGLGQYETARDIPSVPGTSHLSIYFKNGSITVPQALARITAHEGAKLSSSAQKFVTELIWREFYYHILAHRPSVEREAFNPKYRKIAWENREDRFEAWKEGRTGYPIVDAGMRQLRETGWMHNRVRMIVASFLTKDLLVSYTWGERYFMERLLDGDLAPNNGGWQWAASTGCDPQPYFRIFNPTLQGERFDPEGTYVKKWVPELASLDRKAIHEPTRTGLPRGYPAPIVVHSEQSKKAIALFKHAAAQNA